ncbi:hypothetical protein WKW79_00760 [Variovorax robiniae]|uniref:Nucleotidyltransferase family protein n=1 Tax=Variovorax robiniae TaxID=1836199 RepID=A0ABU8WZX0_9BURK
MRKGQSRACKAVPQNRSEASAFGQAQRPITDTMKTIDLLQALSRESVEFVLVGGLAVQLHGYARMTYDVDVVLAMNDANLSRFIEVAKQFGLAPVIPAPIDSLKNASLLDQWHREKGMLAFALREPSIGGGIVDVLVKPEVGFEELSAQAVVGQLLGSSVKIASIDHLLAMKRVANRPKDQLDIIALEKIKRGEDPNA